MNEEYQILAQNPEAVQKFSISNEEFFEISGHLQDKHSIFYRFWMIGKPYFSMDLHTAGVVFDKMGKTTCFMFNPIFWTYLDDYTRRFVICHEMLHIILNHGVRIRGTTKQNKGAINACVDIVDNHLLINKFGFSKSKIQGFSKELFDSYGEYMKLVNPKLYEKQEKLKEYFDKIKKKMGVPEEKSFHGDYRDYCWIDTVFDPDKLPKQNKSFEYYYNALPKIGGSDGGEGCLGGNIGSFDEHDGLAEVENFEEIMKQINEEMSVEEKENLEDMIDDHFEENKELKDVNGESQQAGTGHGSIWTFVNVDPKSIKKNRKWETVIKNWAQKKIKKTYKDVEQWSRVNRRFSMIPKDFFIPTEMEIEDTFSEKDKIKVWFYFDCSGSCYNMKERFFKAAFSLPKDKFEIRTYTFDTSIKSIDINELKAYGFGGTDFCCIERHLQSTCAKEEINPKNVTTWILTDGFDGFSGIKKINPQYPKNYYWFVIRGYFNCIPKDCNTFNLEDFE